MTARPPTRDELLAAARQDAETMPGLASLLADEAEQVGDPRADNARIARDFPGGLRRTED